MDLFFLNMEGGGVLKSHPVPPCLPRFPHPCAWYRRPALCTALQPRLAFCQPPFLCQSDGFCQVPDMLCPHAHKYPRAERGERGAHSDHALHPPVQEHTHAGCTRMLNSRHVLPRAVGIGVWGWTEREAVRVPVLQQCGGCPCVRGGCLSLRGAAGTSLPRFEFLPHRFSPSVALNCFSSVFPRVSQAWGDF